MKVICLIQKNATKRVLYSKVRNNTCSILALIYKRMYVVIDVEHIILISRGPVKAVLGDVSKWIPMSSDRVQAMSSSTSGIVVSLTGTWDENVPIYYLVDNEIRMTNCSVKQSGQCVLTTEEGVRKGN